MANPNPSQGTRFKPGNNANPKGAGSHNPLLKSIRRLTNDQLLDVMNLIALGSQRHLRAVVKDPNASAIEVAYASVFLKIIESGDGHALEQMMNRLVGRVKDQSEAPEQSRNVRVIVTIPSNGREAKGTPLTPIDSVRNRRELA